jgi:hypothetical protein
MYVDLHSPTERVCGDLGDFSSLRKKSRYMKTVKKRFVKVWTPKDWCH